jgi:hypothetical protein
LLRGCKNIPSLKAVPASNAGDGCGREAAAWASLGNFSSSETYTGLAFRQQAWPAARRRQIAAIDLAILDRLSLDM